MIRKKRSRISHTRYSYTVLKAHCSNHQVQMNLVRLVTKGKNYRKSQKDFVSLKKVDDTESSS